MGNVLGHVTDVSGAQRLVAFPAVVVPRLGRNLLYVAVSSATGIVTVFDYVRPQLEKGGVVLQMTRHWDDQTLYSFSMDFVRESDGAAMRVESADLWHTRMGHSNKNEHGCCCGRYRTTGSSTAEM